MKIEEIQNSIDKTAYWDEKILDLKILYFGDEIKIIIDDDDDESSCYKISFLSCFKVLYETDANCRKIENVKAMKKPQLGYYGQDISVYESEEANFYRVNLNLSIMEMQIECKDILVEKILKENLELFWMYN